MPGNSGEKVVAGNTRLSSERRRSHDGCPRPQGSAPLTDVNLKLERVYTVSGKLDMSVFPKATGRLQVHVHLGGDGIRPEFK